MAAEVAGSVSSRVLLEALYTGAARLADSVEQHMGPELPTIGSSEPVSGAVAALEGADAVVVHEDGAPVGVLTRVDLLGYIAGSR
ncbi:MAG: CBS domain-containing protein [Nocardioidaceae bacterium]